MKKHGLSKHPLYHKHSLMMHRCYDQKDKRYNSYGGRGIDVCEKWKNSVVEFYKWSMQNGWKIGLTIDRKNNNNGYYPKNCRFVENKKNNRNKQNSKYWVIFGKVYDSSRDAAEKLSVSPPTIRRWCNGAWECGKFYKPKEGCYSYKKYQ